MAVPTDVYYFIISYLAVLLIALFIVNWITGGFFMAILRVKMSRGKLILVKIRGIQTDYFKPSKVVDGFLIFKDQSKEERRIAVASPLLYKALGVYFVDIDEETNAVIGRNYNIQSGFDAVKYNNLYMRALTRPSLEDKKEIIIIVLLVVLLLAVAFTAYMVYTMDQHVRLLAEQAVSRVI